MKKSIWQENRSAKQFKELSGNRKTDVLIIGGGMAGILCAYRLKNAGVDCILIEADRLASGITKNTTAKITYLHGLMYSKLIRSAGLEKARMYLEANKKALREYENIAQGVDCDFEKRSAYTYSMKNCREIEQEVEAILSLGGAAELCMEAELPFKTYGAVCVHGQAQFNPLKFIDKIAEDLPIFENTSALEIVPGGVRTEKGKIMAKKIIVATHFPFINKHGSYFLKLYQHRSYVCAFENADMPKGMYVDGNLKGLSFRTYKEYLLIGGGAHRTGKQGGGWREIEAFASNTYPKARMKTAWATQDCMSLDGVPYIGQYSKRTPDLYVATGFNKWGMTSAMVAADILCDMVQDKKNDMAEVFSPSRSILKPSLLVNGAETTLNLLTPTTPRCPHMGCALKWNKQEHSWDCPCHGSRFEQRGKLIDNPATGDARIK